jgi:hypothetical protein
MILANHRCLATLEGGYWKPQCVATKKAEQSLTPPIFVGNSIWLFLDILHEAIE